MARAFSIARGWCAHWVGFLLCLFSLKQYIVAYSSKHGSPSGIVAVLATQFSGVVANRPIPKPVWDASKTVYVRYSSTSKRIYLESVDGWRGGCFSPTQIYNTLGPLSPLYPLEIPGEWMLEEELYVLDGIALNVYGTGIGGDCDYLKLRSGSETIVNARAHGGSLDFMHTKVTSWDPSKNCVDTNFDDGRSYINAIFEVVVDTTETCKGVVKNMGEARLDIEDCEIAYLDCKPSESWGISWKLRGLCNNNSNEADYEGLGVYGDIKGSQIHGMYFGHYCYGALNSVITRHTFDDNAEYSLDPHNA